MPRQLIKQYATVKSAGPPPETQKRAGVSPGASAAVFLFVSLQGLVVFFVTRICVLRRMIVAFVRGFVVFLHGFDMCLQGFVGFTQ